MLEHLFTNPFLYSLALTLLHFLWQGALVAIVLKSVLSAVDKSKSQLRYGLSIVALLANLIIAITTFVIILPNDNVDLVQNISPLPLTSLVNELTQSSPSLGYQALIPSILAYSLPYIAMLWLVAVTMLASKLLIEIHNVNKLPKQAHVKPTEELLSRFNALAKQIKLTKAPKLLISLHVDVPMAIGWLKPVVLLPASMVTGLNSAQLEMLILHELAHIHRHDYLVNFFQTLIELLFFFHPAVSWISKQIRNEREYCSDDIAVQHCGDPIAYAHTLTDTASLCANRHQHTIPNMAMAASGGDLKQRVLRLVDHHCAPSNNISKWFASLGILTAVFFLLTSQLVTLPVSKLWNNTLPWQQGSNASFTSPVRPKNLANANQDKPDSAQKQQTFSYDSIAQQLLSSQTATGVETAKILTNATETVSSNNTAPSNNKVTPISSQTHLASNDIVILENSVSSTDKAINKTAYQSLPEVFAPQHKKPQEKVTLTEEAGIVQNYEVTQLTANQAAKKKRLSNASTTNASTTLIQDRASRKASITAKNPASTNELANVALKTMENQPLQFSNPYKEQLNELAQAPVISKSPLLKYATEEKIIVDTLVNAGLTQTSLAQANLTQDNLPSLQINDTSAPSLNAASWSGAKQINTISPEYPSLAKRKGIEIDVKVRFTIDKKGRVSSIKFERNNRIGYFKNAIRAALKKWRFIPAQVNNEPVESNMSKIFSFNLED